MTAHTDPTVAPESDVSFSEPSSDGPDPAATEKAPVSSDEPSELVIRLEDTVPVLSVPPALEFEALRTWMRANLPQRVGLLGGRACRLDLGDRELKLFDLRRLLHLLRDENNVEVTGLYVRPDTVLRYAERELKLKLFPVAGPQATVPVDLSDRPEDTAFETDEVTEGRINVAMPANREDLLEPPAPPMSVQPAPPVILPVEGPRSEPRNENGRRTLNLHRTVRSGAVVQFDGDIVLYGDINPGAQVIATGNIVVLGNLKGMAHAGSGGDESSFILALELQATQLRIGRKIALVPEQHAGGAEQASIQGDQIRIVPYGVRAH